MQNFDKLEYNIEKYFDSPLFSVQNNNTTQYWNNCS